MDGNNHQDGVTPGNWGQETPGGQPPSTPPPTVAIPPNVPMPTPTTPPGTPTPPPYNPQGAPQGTPQFGGTPPQAAPAYPSYGTPGAPVAPPVSDKSGSKLPWILAVGAALVLLVGGGAFALMAFGAAGGGETPEAAVDEMLIALDNEDFVTIAEFMEPSERRTIAEPLITEVLPELVRLGVLDDTADAGAVEGLDIDITDASYRVESVGGSPDIVHVFFNGGEIGAAFDEAEFPFGDEFRDAFGGDIESAPRDSTDLNTGEVPLVLVERDGRWYASMIFTLAENARIQAGERLPTLDEAPPALGSESPEAALTAFLEDLVDLDAEGVIGRMDPEELAAVYRYSPLFLDDIEQGLAELESELRSQGFQWDIEDIDAVSEIDGDDAIVRLQGVTLSVESPDVDVRFEYRSDLIAGDIEAGDAGAGSFEFTPRSFEGDGTVDGQFFSVEGTLDVEDNSIEGSAVVDGDRFTGSVTFDPDGNCSRFTVTAPDDEVTGCIEDELDDPQVDLAIGQLIDGFEMLGNEFPSLPLAARQTDGEWFLSPTTSIMNGFIGGLEDIEDGGFEALVDGNVGVDLIDPLADLGENVASVDDAFVDDDFDDLAIDDDFLDDNFDDDFFEDDFDDEVFEDDFDDDFFEDDFDDGFDDFEEALVEDFLFVEGPLAVVNDSIEVNSFDVIEFEAVGANELVISMVATDPAETLDPLIEVFLPDGGTARNDDHDSSVVQLPSVFDSHLVISPVPDGFYFIEARSFLDNSGGAYELVIEAR